MRKTLERECCTYGRNEHLLCNFTLPNLIEILEDFDISRQGTLEFKNCHHIKFYLTDVCLHFIITWVDAPLWSDYLYHNLEIRISTT